MKLEDVGFPIIDNIFSGNSRGSGFFSEVTNVSQLTPTISSAFGEKNVIITVSVVSVTYALKLYLHSFSDVLRELHIL